MSETLDGQAAYLTVPPAAEMRSCVGLVLAGMAARAHIGVGNLEDAVDLLESCHYENSPTNFRFSLNDDGVIAEVEEHAENGNPGPRWRTVVELVS
ncbi:MAG: hypothetical protein H0V75_04565 [Rubrobacter sp.]|nr:hypothetical protein [Rubrobacter sp.]